MYKPLSVQGCIKNIRKEGIKIKSQVDILMDTIAGELLNKQGIRQVEYKPTERKTNLVLDFLPVDIKAVLKFDECAITGNIAVNIILLSLKTGARIEYPYWFDIEDYKIDTMNQMYNDIMSNIYTIAVNNLDLFKVKMEELQYIIN